MAEGEEGYWHWRLATAMLKGNKLQHERTAIRRHLIAMLLHGATKM